MYLFLAPECSLSSPDASLLSLALSSYEWHRQAVSAITENSLWAEVGQSTHVNK